MSSGMAKGCRSKRRHCQMLSSSVRIAGRPVPYDNLSQCYMANKSGSERKERAGARTGIDRTKCEMRSSVPYLRVHPTLCYFLCVEEALARTYAKLCLMFNHGFARYFQRLTKL